MVHFLVAVSAALLVQVVSPEPPAAVSATPRAPATAATSPLKTIPPHVLPSPAPSVPASSSRQFDIREFGAKGDGATDDTDAIQAAIDAAASAKGAVIIPSSQGPFMFGRVLIKPGVARVQGLGGVLKILRPYPSGNLVLAGKADGLPSNISGLTVAGLVIDANERACVTLRGNSISASHIIDNLIINHRLDPTCPGGAAISLHAPAAGGADSTHNIISRNTISSPTDTVPQGVGGHANQGIQLTGDAQITPGFTTPTAQWKARHAAITTAFSPRYNEITENVIVGGYYGIDLAMAHDNVLTGNRVFSTVRGISVQHGSARNSITGNAIYQTESAGVHLSYGANHNHVANNFLVTGRSAHGEALLQAYVGSTDNTFTGNSVVLEAGAHSQYFAYFGPNSSGNALIANRFEGSPERAGIGVESVWNQTETKRTSYASGKAGADLAGFASRALTDVVISGNVITMLNGDTTPAVFLGQGSDAQGQYALDRVTVSGNIFTRSGRQLDLEEADPGLLRNVSLVGNVFYPTAGPGDFVMPRGRAHFSACTSNSVVDTATVGLAAGTPTPSVSVGKTFLVAPGTPPLRITYFSSGAEQQDIVVETSPNLSIVHDPKRIRLRDGRDVSGRDGGSIRFRLERGVWVEQSRDF